MPEPQPNPPSPDDPSDDCAEVWRADHDRVVIHHPQSEQPAAYGGDNAEVDAPTDRPQRHTRGRRATDPQGIEPSRPV